MNLSRDIKVTRVLNGVAAGTSTQNGSALDMQGYEGVIFLAAIGTITSGAVTSLKAQEGDTSSPTADLTGSGVTIADTESNKVAMLEIVKPGKRYIRPVLVRGTQNAVIDGIIAIQYGARVKPPTQDTTVMAASKVVVSPIAGTA